jgi:ABC-type sugar transport system substrate-binding protein
MVSFLNGAWSFLLKRFCPAVPFRQIAATGLSVIMLLGTAQAASRPSVVFMSPDTSRYWTLQAGFMQAVAEDLDINLEVLVDKKRNRFSYIRMADSVLSRADKPDYLIFMCREKVTTPMLRMANDAGVKVFTFDTNLPVAAQQALGAPRQVLKNWIGHVSPDNVAAGRTLARMLAQQARKQNLQDPGRALSTLALSGTLDSSAAIDRNTGLQQAIDNNDMQLLQLVYADWKEEEARVRTRALLKRYPDTAVVWSASDGMALGAIDASKQAGRRPGEDVLIGGIDWEPRALDAVRRGELAVSLGRHFMGGGLVLLLLNDYDQGYDFARELPSPVLHYELGVVTQDNVDAIEWVVNPDNWQQVNFARFSRAQNPDLRNQAPDASRLMDGFISALEAEGGS